MQESGPGFIHLHGHSSYSLREGALTIVALSKLALADAMPALAITDSNNLFGALEFSEKLAGEGIQPIIGMQTTLGFADAEAFSTRADRAAAGFADVVLLAQDERGYANLMRLSSQLWLESDPAALMHLPIEKLVASSEGLLLLTGGPNGPLDRCFAAGRETLAQKRLDRLRAAFDNRLYIEVQRHGSESERQVEPALLDLAYRLGLPLVASNDAYFAGEKEFEAHDALICIADGTFIGADERRRMTKAHYFKSRAAMIELFADLPEACANSVEIARRCAYRPRTRKPILPNFSVAGEHMDEAAQLRKYAGEGLEQRLEVHGMAPGLSRDDYVDRLNFELDVIERMQFPGYFLIVADFIQYAKSQGIPVGPGRGSGAGSLVAFCLTITDLDPLRFGLLFERFLNPERISMPDFDIDFCQERREEVIAYVRERYGADRVAQIITFGSFLARGVLRNVGRVLELPLGQVDRLAKMVPQNPAKPISLKEAIDSEPRLREAAEAEPRVDQLLRIARDLEGLYSNASTHAAGIVIGDRPLHELVPLYRDPKSDMPATQFNMKWVEPAGLVKFDFLGLKTLTVLAKAVELLKKRQIDVDLAKIPLVDSRTFAMLGRGETIGVFQLESAGMRKALIEMRADRFEDIIALVALYRPGPMANIPTYCARKLGEEDCDYYHPLIEPILSETFGVIIYQEQVMQIAQTLSGYSLGEADMLRRAMGKKIKSEMDAQRARFVEGALKKGLTKTAADEIFDLLAKFADYGFNKSHAAAYALIAYQTAWFKANFPVEFIAASMTLDMGNTDKLSEFRAEANRLGIHIAPADINYSGLEFEVHSNEAQGLHIRYALTAIKGVGSGQAGSLVASRADKPFVDLADFACRLNPREVNRKVLEMLAAAGAFSQLQPDRAQAFAAADQLLAVGNSAREQEANGQAGLFAGTGGEQNWSMPQVPSWSGAELLRREFDAVGFFISGHPLDAYGKVMQQLRLETWSKFSQVIRAGGSMVRVAATVLDRTERRTKTGNKMGIVTLSDPTGQYEAILFQEGLNQYRDLLETGKNLVLTLQGDLNGDEVRARIAVAEDLDQAASRIQKGLKIFLRQEKALHSLSERLRQMGSVRSDSKPGELFLVLMLDEARGEVEMKLPGRFPIGSALSGALKEIAGVVAVEPV